MHNARSLMLSIVMSVLFCLTLSPGTASAQVSCGGAGAGVLPDGAHTILQQRAGRSVGMYDRQLPVPGRRQPVLRHQVVGHLCRADLLRGKDERACCITETRYGAIRSRSAADASTTRPTAASQG